MKYFWKGLIANDANFESEPARRSVVFKLGTFMSVDGEEGELNGIAGIGLLGVGDAPSAVIPVAKFHPAGVTAAQSTILGQTLLGPVTPPIFKARLQACRNCFIKVHNDGVYFTRAFPH